METNPPGANRPLTNLAESWVQSPIAWKRITQRVYFESFPISNQTQWWWLRYMKPSIFLKSNQLRFFVSALRFPKRRWSWFESAIRRSFFRGKSADACTATEMIPTIEMIPAIEMIPNHHRNDPHHRNDTGGHHRNDPRNIGNGIKGTRKTGQQFSACFLFIYIASFLRCAIYLLPHFILQ